MCSVIGLTNGGGEHGATTVHKYSNVRRSTLSHCNHDCNHNSGHRQLGSVEQVGQIGVEDFQSLNKALVRLERFWTDQIRYRL